MNEGVGAVTPEDKLRARILERQKSLGTNAQPSATTPPTASSTYQEDVPDVGVSTNPEIEALDRSIKSMSIIDAYNKWANKGLVPATSRKEGIKVSCPNPAHPDRNPSAWLNTTKNTYYCGGCAQGGDIWDIAAWHFGFAVPQYKNTEDFKALKAKIAESLGFHTLTSVTGALIVIAPEQPTSVSNTGNSVKSAPAIKSSTPQTEDSTVNTTTPSEESEGISKKPPAPTSSPGLISSPSNKSTEVNTSSTSEYSYGSGPEIPWRDIIPEHTFMHEWLTATTVDDCAEEYHFWTGLMALGFSIGRNVLLEDVPRVVGNLFVCLVGPSGSKKSQAKRYLKETVLEVMPYDYDNPFSNGTKVIGGAGSGEYLLSSFGSVITDPSSPTKVLGHAPVRGLIDYEEFATLATTAARSGSTIKTNLMDIYDAQRQLQSGSQGAGRRVAEDPFGQAISTTQNDSLAGLLTKSDDGSGFVNRWIFASGKLKKVRSWGTIQVDLKKSHGLLREVYMWANHGHRIHMTTEALDVWDKYFHNLIVPTKHSNEAIGSAMLNRIDLTLKKLILLFCANEKLDHVPARIVDKVFKLFDYLVETYGIVAQNVSRTEANDLADVVITKIKDICTTNPDGPTASELKRALSRKFKSAKQVNDLLADLLKLDLIIETGHKPKGPGRPSKRYTVHE